MAMIDVRGLRVRFQSRALNPWARCQASTEALKGIDLAVAGGSTLGLVGPSGCGKTTLCRAIAGRIVPSEGYVTVAGSPYARPNRREVPMRQRARTVQVVGQTPERSFDPRSHIWEAVAEPLRIHGIKRIRTRVEKVLMEVGLHEELWQRRPHQLSGGQLQRVAIARALVLSPSVLLLDEPTSMLDVSVQARVLEILRRLRAEHGVTMLLVTHDLELAASFCDEISVMRDGEIVESGEADRLVRTPRHPFTDELVNAFRTTLPEYTSDSYEVTK